MRGIPSADNLIAQVEGHIADVAGVLKITRIHLTYSLTLASDDREKFDRALEVYAEKCPAYQSVKGCIECTWDTNIRETG